MEESKGMRPITEPMANQRSRGSGLLRRLGAAATAAVLISFATVAMAGKGDCGQPLSTGSGPAAVDCIFILKFALGIGSCEMCVCDLDNSKKVGAADALRCLKKAVGQGVSLGCPSCSPATTTTTEFTRTSSTSTTTSSTSSTSSTLPVHCAVNADCGALPPEFRCNPNTGDCEKPCSKNTDCKLFYQCNKTTKYCEEPALRF